MVSVALAESRRAGTEEEGGRERQQLLWPSPNPGDIVFRSSTSRYFCGEGRSSSPFGTYIYTLPAHKLTILYTVVADETKRA